MAHKVAVVGAGIIGMTTARRIKSEMEDVHVTVIAEHFTPHTANDEAAGFFMPQDVSGVPDEKLREWFDESYSFYRKLLLEKYSSDNGLAEVPAYYLQKNMMPKPAYADTYPPWRELTMKDVDAFPNYKRGYYFISMIIECKKFLPYLMGRFLNDGGNFIGKKVNEFEELFEEYDVIINCSGIGARDLCQDESVSFVCEQTTRVNAPWIKHAVIADDGFYVIPNIHDVVLGGNSKNQNLFLIPDDDEAKAIWKGCSRLVPCLKPCTFIRYSVTLRPGNGPLKLYFQDLPSKDGGKTFPVIHNYGHGASEICLAWGCAGEVVKLLKNAISKKKVSFSYDI